MNDFRDTITTKVLSNIPSYIKPIDYLMETLNISRESVYRRVRGDISFTLEEIAKLSIELGFSVDELIGENKYTRIFFDLQTTSTKDSSDIYVIMFRQYCHQTFDIAYNKDIESVMICNHIPMEFIVQFDCLFKFLYYRWMHQYKETSLKYYFSDIILPEELASLQQKIIDNSKRNKNNTFIFDENIFLNLISEIQYYYKRKLINEDEFLQIKGDLHRMINMVESIAQTGFHYPESKFSIYLSSLSIDMNSRYFSFDGQALSQFFVSSIEPIVVSNPAVCAVHKKWLDSRRKYATLISQSNEILQIKYFSKQRSYVDKIAELGTFFV